MKNRFIFLPVGMKAYIVECEPDSPEFSCHLEKPYTVYGWINNLCIMCSDKNRFQKETNAFGYYGPLVFCNCDDEIITGLDDSDLSNVLNALRAIGRY